MTDPLVCVTPEFKSQPQKFGTSCNDILNVLGTAKKTHWRNWSPHHPHLSTSALSGDQHILNSAREARWFVSRWKKWNHVSGLKSLPLHLIGPFSLCKEYAPLPACFFCWLLFITKDPQMYWHWSLFNTSVSGPTFQQTLQWIRGFKMWDGGGRVGKRSGVQLRQQGFSPRDWGRYVLAHTTQMLFWLTGSLGKQMEQNLLANG